MKHVSSAPPVTIIIGILKRKSVNTLKLFSPFISLPLGKGRGWAFTLLILPVFMLSSLVLCAQNPDGRIYWSGDIILKWKDFKGKQDNNHPYDAETNWAVEYSCGLKSDTLSFTLKCYFDKNGSWVKKGKETGVLLNHERKHFDLGEVYARKLRKVLLEHAYNRETINEDIQKLYNDMFAECQVAQKQYDKETEHSKNKDKQEKWDAKIISLLKKLEAYTRHTYKLPLKQ